MATVLRAPARLSAAPRKSTTTLFLAGPFEDDDASASPGALITRLVGEADVGEAGAIRNAGADIVGVDAGVLLDDPLGSPAFGEVAEDERDLGVGRAGVEPATEAL